MATDRGHSNSKRFTRADDPERALGRIQAALETVAHLVVDDPIYVPIFKRLEQESEALRATRDVIARARSLAAQRAIA